MNECDGEEIDFDLINLEPEPEGSSKWDKENQKEQLTDEKVVEMQENGIWYWNIGENLMKMKYIIVYDIKTEFFFHLKVTNILFDKVFLSKGRWVWQIDESHYNYGQNIFRKFRMFHFRFSSFNDYDFIL